MYVPFTGLGLYNGFRGNRWLRNRITVFKQFVVPSLQAQTNKNFTLWIGWRPEERNNPHVKELWNWLHQHTNLDVVFTHGGLCFWDDKYPDDVAKSRLATNLHLTMRELIDNIGDVDDVYMTIQPSDDCYRSDAVDVIQKALKLDINAFGFTKGYIMNYATGEVSEYNPNTNPPFYTIKFSKDVFIDPQRHVAFAPIKSHEYVKDHMKYGVLDERGFLVGTHGENVSTYYDHPFKGERVYGVAEQFGLKDVRYLHLPISIRKKIMRRLPHYWRRKIRYWFGERLYAKIYDWLRN